MADESPGPAQVLYRPTTPFQGQLDAVNRLQIAVATGISEQNKLQARIEAEGKLHDELHAKMLVAETAVVSKISQTQRVLKTRGSGVVIGFKAGKEKGLLAKPKLKIKGQSHDARVDSAIASLRREFEEYIQKWRSHRGTDKRLISISKSLQHQEKATDQTTKRLEKAQQAIARATEAQAKQAEKAAKLQTPGFFEMQRKLAKQRADTKREKIESRNALAAAKRERGETARAIKSQKAAARADKEQARKMHDAEREQTRAARADKKQAREMRDTEREQANKMHDAEREHARQVRESEQMKRQYGMPSAPSFRGVASRRTGFPEVYVKKHRRRI